MKRANEKEDRLDLVFLLIICVIQKIYLLFKREKQLDVKELELKAHSKELRKRGASLTSEQLKLREEHHFRQFQQLVEGLVESGKKDACSFCDQHRREYRLLQLQFQCVVCCNNIIDVINIPCGHTTVNLYS